MTAVASERAGCPARNQACDERHARVQLTLGGMMGSCDSGERASERSDAARATCDRRWCRVETQRACGSEASPREHRAAERGRRRASLREQVASRRRHRRERRLSGSRARADSARQAKSLSQRGDSRTRPRQPRKSSVLYRMRYREGVQARTGRGSQAGRRPRDGTRPRRPSRRGCP